MTGPTGSGLFDPISDADRRRWQIQTHAVLATVLQRASTAGLAPLQWNLGAAGQLRGTVNVSGRAAEDLAGIYTAWADFLNLTIRRSVSGSRGTVHHWAFGDLPDRADQLGRPVLICADLHSADDIDPTTEEC
ncbi:hypothetical protein [Amycolatopsis sp. CA-128772]|uniref:hypothetical protein n=1 Tax=Amycolatopsis sp. CA-128772 TaxID=2073159 RepID=UPI000CD2485B|nr:hypothetical protein [Amycolatopsis sp. CA-128772]